MSAYTDFVKKHYGSVRHLPPKDRMAAIAKMWRAQGHSGTHKRKAKGGGLVESVGRFLGI